MAEKKAAKKSAKKAVRKSPLGPFGQAQTPITIGGGSMFVHFKRSDFQKSGDTDNHKNLNTTITHLRIDCGNLVPPKDGVIDIDITEPITIKIYYT